jgi:hypothetical protein
MVWIKPMSISNPMIIVKPTTTTMRMTTFHRMTKPIVGIREVMGVRRWAWVGRVVVVISKMAISLLTFVHTAVASLCQIWADVFQITALRGMGTESVLGANLWGCGRTELALMK